MRRFYLLGFLALMAFDTLAQISFKYAGAQALPLEFGLPWLLRVFTQPWIYGAFVGYVGAFFCWMTLLKHAPIGPAFAASHLEIVSVLLVSVWLFGETIGTAQVVGGLLIVAGIVCLAISETADDAPGGLPGAGSAGAGAASLAAAQVPQGAGKAVADAHDAHDARDSASAGRSADPSTAAAHGARP